MPLACSTLAGGWVNDAALTRHRPPENAIKPSETTWGQWRRWSWRRRQWWQRPTHAWRIGLRWKGNIYPQGTCPVWFLFDQMAYIRWYIWLFIEAGAGRKQLPCVRVTGWHPSSQQDLPARQIERKLFKLKRDAASYHSYSVQKLIIHAPCGKDSTMKLG